MTTAELRRNLRRWNNPLAIPSPSRGILCAPSLSERKRQWTNELVVGAKPSSGFRGDVLLLGPDLVQLLSEADLTSAALLFKVVLAQRRESQGDYTAALDIIYASMDEIMRRGDFAAIDTTLAHVDASELSVAILLGLLTSTLPAADRLKERRAFFETVRATLSTRGELETGLLCGLDG